MKSFKALVVTVIILIPFFCSAQIKNFTSVHVANEYDWLKAKYYMGIPKYSSSPAVPSSLDAGGIYFNLTDTSLYTWSGTAWRKVGSGTLTATDTVSLSNRINQRWALTGNSSTDSATNRIGTTDAKPFSLITNSILRGIISSTGNWGIGTTTPAAKLHIYTDANNYSKLGGSIQQIVADDSVLISGDNKVHIFSDAITLNATGNATYIPYGFNAGTSNSISGYLTIGSDLNFNLASFPNKVGLGTTTPQSKLHVAGTIRGTDSLIATGLVSSADTSTFKPLGINSSGNVIKMPYYQAGGGGLPALTTGQVGYGVAGVLGSSGRLTFAPSTGLTIDSALYLSNSTSGIGGNIYKNSSLWLHNRGDASNISLGFGTGTNGTGSNNTAIGQSSFASNTTGTRNVAIGLAALNVGTNLDNSVAIGWEAMRYATNTTDGTVTNTIAIGASALANVRTGYSNIAIGKLSLTEFLDGTGNAIVGASNRLQSGAFNSGIGSDAWNTNLMNGSYNSFVGGYAMAVKKSGNYNTAIGNHTLASDSTGGYNTMLGSYAGTNNNGSYNTFLGNFAGAYETNRSTTIIIDGDWSPAVGMKYTIVGQAHDKKIAINKTTGELDANPENFQVGGSVRLDSTVRLDKADIAIAPSTRWKLALDTATGLIVRDSVSGGAAIDTANKWVNTITRVPGKDSIIFYVGTTRYAVKDSLGAGSSKWTESAGSIYTTERVAMGTSSVSTTVGLLVKGVGSGTDNVAEFRNSSNTLLARVREDGYLLSTNVIDDDQHAALTTAGVKIGGGSLLAWSNNAYSWETLDAGISRTAAATLAVGNGTAGNTTGTILAARALSKQGADVASTAGAMTLGTDGTTFEITGTNSITLLSNVGWVNGNEVTLLFTGAATLVNGTATSGTNIIMKLAGAVDFVATADDTITLVLSEIGGTQAWREKCRSVN